MHITDTYQINTVQSKKEIKRLKKRGKKKKNNETDHGPIRQFHDRSWTDFEGSVQAQCSTVM